MTRRRCAEIVAVRHAESTANAALAGGVATGGAGDVTAPDADIPLTARGEGQSSALGDALAGWPADRLPDAVLCSPYLRARRTYEIASSAAAARGVTLPPARIDERLPDRQMGALAPTPFPRTWPMNALTASGGPVRLGVATQEMVDGAYHDRPPGGESLADVTDRVLSLLADVNRRYADQRVLLVAHDAIVSVLHYLIDRPSLADFTQHLGENPAANASITRWAEVDGKLRMVEYSTIAHVSAD